MKRILMIGILLLLGCDSVPVETYSVKLISPNGKIQDKWEIQSRGQPTKQNSWGGRTILRDMETGGRSWWEKDIVAPEGWILVVKRKRDE